MTNAQVSLELLDALVGEDVVDHSHSLVHIEVLRVIAIARNDASRF